MKTALSLERSRRHGNDQDPAHRAPHPVADHPRAAGGGAGRANDPEIEGVDVIARPALAATLPDMLDADGYLFGTTADFGYLCGALKHYVGGYPTTTDKAS
ncbi:hypothetical protein BZL30_0368 [Mycobacterium kansasii]|uniref:Uncharacterized protein n=2 Tax=Mycobacterium kansasii TaxID=1768 RepID=A0A1V3XRW8_MYCKA|nr:hypothetical protein BZL30_0368 [Mycobacterium kansasii]